jgi:hypothetical protein
MRLVLLLLVGFALAGSARERSGIVTRVEGKNTLRVAGAEGFLAIGIPAPASDPATRPAGPYAPGT